MEKPAGYVGIDYLKRAANQLAELKELTHSLLQIKPGDSILDLGCGPGLDTVPMAKLVGETGRVVGVDVDEEMLESAETNARKESVHGWTSHRKADVRALPFDDSEFDGVRAERLFQVLDGSFAPEEIMAEALRVLRPGGRLVLADTDWASASVDFDDFELERRLMAFFARHLRPNGLAGRQFLRLCREQGLMDLQVQIHPVPMYDFAKTPFGNWLKKEALAAQIATESEMECWVDELARRTSQGVFFAVTNMVVVSGKKQ
ncbi:MAG: methyltransferase domain-containing protein [Deltaproteobacteria bacterium]|nr:methyltransferase domain-containing protein [Deltaproteobacteria bacterium]